jgi:hypothetical protein
VGFGIAASLIVKFFLRLLPRGGLSFAKCTPGTHLYNGSQLWRREGRAIVPRGHYRAFVWLAAILAFALHLDNPWWAVISAWVVTSPERHVPLKKAANCLIGTRLNLFLLNVAS